MSARKCTGVAVVAILICGFVTAGQAFGAPQAATDLSGQCGSNFRETVARMRAGAISGERASDCFCFFWKKAGSKPGLMFNGKPVAEFCAHRP